MSIGPVIGAGGYTIIKEEPVQATDLVYNGKLQSVTWANYDTNMMKIVEDSGDQKNAGTYTVGFKPIKHYCWSNGTQKVKYFDWTIKQRALSAPTLAISTRTYNGTYQSPDITYDSAIAECNDQPSDVFTIEHLSEKFVNSYTISWVIKNDNYVWKVPNPAKKTATWKIEPKQITIPTVTNTTFTYSGNQQGPTITPDTSNDWTKTGYRGTNAEDYEITFSLTDPDNTIWKGTNSNADRTVPWVINRLVITKPTGSPTTFTYNGSAQGPNISNDPSTTFVKVTGNKTSTNAGTYSIVYNLFHNTADAINTVWSGTPSSTTDVTISYEIKTLKIPIPSASSTSILYDTLSHTPGATDMTQYTKFLDITGTGTATDVGEYSVVYNIKSSVNASVTGNKYNVTWTDDSRGQQKIDWQITVRRLTKPTLSTGSFVFQISDINVTNYEQNYNVLYMERTGTTTASTVTVNGYEVTYTLRCNKTNVINTVWADSTNSTTPVKLKWYITKKSLSIPAQTGNLTYDTTVQTASWNSNYLSDYMKVSGNTGTDAAIYTATFTSKYPGNAQFGTSDTATATWRIGVLSIPKPTLTGPPYTYDTTEKIPTRNNENLTYMSRTGDIKGTIAKTYTITYTLSKNTTSVTNVKWSNDNSTSSVPLSWVIKKAAISKPTVSKGTISLTGSSPSTTFTVTRQGNGAVYATSDNANVTVSVNGTTVTVTAQGSCTATITVTIGEGDNYLATTQSTAVTIPVTATDFISNVNVASTDLKQINIPTYDPNTTHIVQIYGYNSNTMNMTGTTSAKLANDNYVATVTCKTGYQFTDGKTIKDVTWKINKAAASKPTLSKASITLTGSSPSTTFTVTRNGTGTVSAVSNNSNVTVSISGTTVTVTAKDNCTATITVSVSADNNYFATTASTAATIPVTAKDFAVKINVASTDLKQINIPTYNPDVTQTVTIQGYDSNTMTLSGTTTAKTPSTSGYIATVTCKSGYQFTDGVTSKNVTWNINKAKLVPTMSVTGTEMTIDWDTQPTATLTNLLLNSYSMVANLVPGSKISISIDKPTGVGSFSYTSPSSTPTNYEYIYIPTSNSYAFTLEAKSYKGENTTSTITVSDGAYYAGCSITLSVSTSSYYVSTDSSKIKQVGTLTWNNTEQTATFSPFDSRTMTVTDNTGTAPGSYNATIALQDGFSGALYPTVVKWIIEKRTCIPLVLDQRIDDIAVDDIENHKISQINGEEGTFYTFVIYSRPTSGTAAFIQGHVPVTTISSVDDTIVTTSVLYDGVANDSNIVQKLCSYYGIAYSTGVGVYAYFVQFTGLKTGTVNFTLTITVNERYSSSSDAYCYVNYSPVNLTFVSGKKLEPSAPTVSTSLLRLRTEAESAKTGSVTVTRDGNGTVTATSSNTDVATVTGGGSVVRVTGVNPGDATITIHVAEGQQYKAVPANLEPTVPVKVYLNSLTKPTVAGSTTTNNGTFTKSTTIYWNGLEHTVQFNNFDSTIMTATGTKGTDVGTYTATVSTSSDYYFVGNNYSNIADISWKIRKRKNSVFWSIYQRYLKMTTNKTTIYFVKPYDSNYPYTIELAKFAFGNIDKSIPSSVLPANYVDEEPETDDEVLEDTGDETEVDYSGIYPVNVVVEDYRTISTSSTEGRQLLQGIYPELMNCPDISLIVAEVSIYAIRPGTMFISPDFIGVNANSYSTSTERMYSSYRSLYIDNKYTLDGSIIKDTCGNVVEVSNSVTAQNLANGLTWIDKPFASGYDSSVTVKSMNENYMVSTPSPQIGNYCLYMTRAKNTVTVPNLSTIIDLANTNWTIDFWMTFFIYPDIDREFERVVLNFADIIKVCFNTVKIGNDYTFETSHYYSSSWTHYAVTYNKTKKKCSFFIDGHLETENISIDLSTFTPTVNALVMNGVNDYTDGVAFNEVRVSSKARWTEDFSPEDNPYRKDSNTKILLQFNR